MPAMTDCAARGTVTAGCSCDFCRGDGVIRDGGRFRVPAMFLDHAATAASKEINTMSNPHGLTRENLAGVQINGRLAADVFMLDGPSPAFLDGLSAGQRTLGVRPGLDAAQARRQAAHDAYADRLAGRDGIGAEQDAYGAYRRRLADAWRSQAA